MIGKVIKKNNNKAKSTSFFRDFFFGGGGGVVVPVVGGSGVIGDPVNRASVIWSLCWLGCSVIAGSIGTVASGTLGEGDDSV
jgi:hypothetical protein